MGSSEAAEVNYHGTIEDANRLESSEPLKERILKFLQFVCGKNLRILAICMWLQVVGNLIFSSEKVLSSFSF